MQYDPWEKLQNAVSRLQNDFGRKTISGPVKEIKEGQNGEVKMKVVIGQQDGKEVLSPWLPMNEHRSGEGTQRKPFKKGQNVMVQTVNGNIRQGYCIPSQEAEHAQAPAQAKTNGIESWTQEVGGKAYTTIGKGGSFQEMFLAESANKPKEWKSGVGKSKTTQGNGDGASSAGSATGEQQAKQQEQGGGSQAPKPAWKFVMEEKDGMAMCNVKDKADALVDDVHSRIKYEQDAYFIRKGGLVCVTKPPIIDKLPKQEHPRASKA